MRYNQPHTEVHVMAQSVGQYFKQKWEPQEAALLDKYQTFLDGGGVLVRPPTVAIKTDTSPKRRS